MGKIKRIRWARVAANIMVIGSWLFGLAIIIISPTGGEAQSRIEALVLLFEKLFPSLTVLMGGIVGTSIVEKIGHIVKGGTDGQA